MSRASERSSWVQDGGKSESSARDTTGAYVRRFPESFQRTDANRIDRDRERDMSDSANESTPSSEINLVFNISAYEDAETEEVPPRHFSSRSVNVMRLENILNAVSIDTGISHHPEPVGQSRSLESEFPLQAGSSHEFEPTSSVQQERIPDAESGSIKKKKVKMHRCPECHKDFPRPSGLRTHMNIHTKEKPFSCIYPGCTRSFSVVSNAKRHMRTHGTSSGGPDEIDSGASVPYYNVGFEPPVIVGDEEEEAGRSTAPVRLRWLSASAERGKRASGSGGSVITASSVPSSARADSAIARRVSIDVGVAPDGRPAHKIRTTTSLPRR